MPKSRDSQLRPKGVRIPGSVHVGDVNLSKLQNIASPRSLINSICITEILEQLNEIMNLLHLGHAGHLHVQPHWYLEKL